MLPIHRRILPLLALSGALLSGCTSSSLSRIDDNRAVYESWPIEVQEAVLNKRAMKGMTPEQVTMAMGKPSSVDRRSGRDGGDDEVWIYQKGGGLGSGLGPIEVGTGTSIGGVGIYTSKTVGTGRASLNDRDEVIFTNGVVSSTDLSPR
jgi:hypothetical protein